MVQEVSPMIAIFQTYPGSSNITDMYTTLIESIQSLRDAVLEEDWKKVRILAASCLGLAGGAKRLLEIEGDSFRAKMKNTKKVAITLDEILQKIAMSRNDAAIKATLGPIKDSLTQFPDELARFEIAFQKLQNGETAGIPLIENMVNADLFSIEPIPLRLVREIALAGASRGLLGLIHADFNLSLASARLFIGELGGLDVKADMLSVYDKYRNSLQNRQMQLQQVIVQRDSNGAIHEALVELLDFIERKLPVFARAQAWIYLLSESLRNQGKGGAAEEMGKIAAKAGQITRESIAVHVSCLRIVFELASTKISDEVEEMFSEASVLPFEVNLPNGTDVELSKLGVANDGQFVEISGFVTSHEAVRTGDQKLVSRLDIHDPSSGVSTRAAAVFTHLAHSGVTRGAYCRISGIFRTDSILLDGEGGVEIDRLSLADLAKDSWYVTFLRLSEQWYQAWRNGTNMLWGLGPQTFIADNGEVDEVASSFGAGELIFPPFVRE